MDTASARFRDRRSAGIRAALGIALFLFGLHPAFPYPVNSWKHISSGRFTVSYSEEAEHLAGRALAIAEETAGVLADYFGYQFRGGRISIVLADQADESNGWASARDPLVFIDCRKSPFLFRGETDWLRTVLTHELSHVYSLDALNPPVVIGAFVGISSEAENFDAEALEWVGLNGVPIWFIEGVAQLGSYRLEADFRDPMREMVLRDALLSGCLLDAREMARFEGTSRDYELAYNQGFSFLLYLQQRFGEVAIRDLCRDIRNLGLEQAAQAAYRRSLEELLEEWKADLLSRYGGGGSWGAGEPLFLRGGPMPMELAAARSGEYVLANWGNDYNRFSLFRRAKGGRYREIARDCGQVLKEDRATGEVWFNRYAYNPGSGVDNFDIYRVRRDGGLERVTRGSRSIAFDALDGRLVYARYRPGRTEIVRRRPDGGEETIGEVPREYAVYAVSIASPDMVLLSLGTGGGTRLALLADGKLVWLWKDQDILDPVSAGGSRVIFTATRDGTPQLYWADPREDPGRWYQLTGVQGGARFPALDGGSAPPRLVYAVYGQGGYRLHAQPDPFLRDHPVKVDGSGMGEPVFAPPAPAAAAATSASFNPVWSRPTFLLGLVSSRYAGASGIATDWTGLAGVSGSIYNAPENLGLDAGLQLAFPLLAGVSLPPAVGLELLGTFHLGPFYNELKYSLATEVYYLGPGSHETFFHHTLYADGNYQLTSRQAVAAVYELAWHSFTVTGYQEATWLAFHTAGLRWIYVDSPRSAFDPANLGGPLLELYAGADLKYVYFPDPGYVDVGWDEDPHLIGRFLARARWQVLSPGSRLAAGARLEGFSYLNGIRGGLPTPGLFPGIGGSGSFSGYPAYYADLLISDLLKAAVAVSANPFVDKAGPTHWYERAALDLKLEAGWIRYWAGAAGALRTGYPLSAEIGLRQGFYLRANRQSSAFLRVAVPLNDFAGTIERPWQIYLGYGQ